MSVQGHHVGLLVGGGPGPDPSRLAWVYDFPTRDLNPIAGLIAFYNEKLDIFLDGIQLERPETPFSRH